MDKDVQFVLIMVFIAPVGLGLMMVCFALAGWIASHS